MNNNSRRRKKKLSGEKIFSIVVTCAIVLTLAFGVISVIRNTNNNSSNPDNKVDLNETQDNVALNPEPDSKADVVSDNNAKATKSTEETKAPVETTKETSPAVQNEEVPVGSPTGASAKYTFGDNDTLVWPVTGDIVMKYSVDSTIYFKTLGVYKTNPSISIASTVGTNVAAAASGVVDSVVTNEETGTTVTVSIGNEYKVIYGLIDGITVKKGDTIVAGQYLGKIAEPTKYYTSEGANLYFKMTKGNAPVDPALFLE